MMKKLLPFNVVNAQENLVIEFPIIICTVLKENIERVAYRL